MFALALSLAAGRLAERWGEELSRSATLRISAPAEQMAEQTGGGAPGAGNNGGGPQARGRCRRMSSVRFWNRGSGRNIPVETLPIPQLIEVIEGDPGYDADGLRLRLQAEVPGAVLDDHTRWRRPLIEAASRLLALGWLSIGLIFTAMAAMITLAANAALAANAQVIAVLRLVGARDSYIAAAFERRFTLRALSGAAVGMVAGLVAVWFLPEAQEAGGFLTGLGFAGAGWLWPLIIPPLAAGVGFAATRNAARKTLRGLS